MAARVCEGQGGKVYAGYAGGASFEVSYLRPVRGGSLLARGRVLHLGRRLAHAVGEIYLEGSPVAFAKGTFYRLEPDRAQGGR